MHKDEWMQRYKAHIMETCPGMTEEMLQDCADNVDFDALDQAELSDPEGMADDEMSYWDDDSDEDEEEA